MGTTLQALQAGSANYVYVVAIEGYGKLLTNHHTPSAAVTAHAATSGGDYTEALGGLYVDLQNEQSITPTEALTRGGQCLLHVMPDPAADEPDQFGIDVARRAFGWETQLTAGIDRASTSIEVKSTSLMDAEGVCYVGTEAIAYEVASGTAITAMTRGLWSPFAAGGSGSPRFAEHHRVVIDPQAAKLRPLVTQYPRTWLGKWVGVWMHRVVGGVLDVVGEAQLVYAGRIASIKDDETTGATVVELKHVLDYIRETSVGRDMWTARLQPGIYLDGTITFAMRDWSNVATATYRDAQVLEVLASGASGPNQINAGYYSLSALCSAITTWLQAERAAGRLYGDYSMASPVSSPLGPRTKIYWQIGASTSVQTRFMLVLPKHLAVFLGYTTGNVSPSPYVSEQYAIDSGNDNGGELHHCNGDSEPVSSVLFYSLPYVATTPPIPPNDLWSRVQVAEQRGTLVDQYASMPSGAHVASSSEGRAWGVFFVDDQFLVSGSLDGDTLRDIRTMTAYGETTSNVDLDDYTIPLDRESVEIKQVFIFDASEATLLKWLLLSTGTEGYNHATYDKLGYGLGLGVPGSLGPRLVESIDALPGADASLIAIIDKTKNVADLLAGDLAIRRAFTRWKNGVEFCTWRIPTLSASVASLDEGTKAAPANTEDSHRTTTTEAAEWARPIVKIQYNRDITDSSAGDGYMSTVTLEDSTSVDDIGGDVTALTIRAANTYGQHVLTGQGVEALIPGYLAMLPLFSRPRKSMSRSLDPRWWEGLAVGDIVDITDAFARDPSTGRRGVSSRPALITAHRYSPGGAMPPTGPGDSPVNPAGGEIQAYFLDVDRVNPYGPAADVNESATNAGYDVGLKTLTCKPHSFSEATAPFDASWFRPGYHVTITEIDPAGSPLSWSDVVASQFGSTITLTTGLSGWDPTKHYRVRFDDYASAVAAQHGFAYGADGVTGMLDGTTPPHQYTIGQAEPTYTSNATLGLDGGPVELMGSSAGGAGVSRDVGYEAALIQLINNTIDYKTAVSSPVLHAAVSGSGLVAPAAWKLVSVCPIYLGKDAPTNAVRRYITVAPFFRSTDGSTAQARISISRSAPTGASIYDVDRGPVVGDVTFSTTSTTFSTPTANIINLKVKGDDGAAWIYLEVSAKCETRGIARCHVGPRSPA